MKTILAVDDSPMMRQMLKHTLDEGGFASVLAEDGVQALELFQKQSFDAVVTDINMPNMDGLTLIAELRKLNTEIPIMTLTTEAEDDMKRKGAAAGANGWIVKPMEPEQLIDILKQIL
ncbi:MAG: response regulator [Leptospirales bacterium]|nr:response regulator [Leptospirales bacterium]